MCRSFLGSLVNFFLPYSYIVLAVDSITTMLAYIQRLFGSQQEPTPVPTPVTIVAARFPAGETPPHLLQLQTTSSLDIPRFHSFSIDDHAPDLTAFWDIPNPWPYAHKTRLEVTQQSTNWISSEGVLCDLLHICHRSTSRESELPSGDFGR